jgi:PHP family Zn ribbon phosphoesterase
MTACPRCKFELTDDDRRANSCPRCGELLKRLKDDPRRQHKGEERRQKPR